MVIFTKTKKLDPNYQLTIQYQASGSSSDMKEIKIQAPFMQWFTADGFFVSKPFQQWLASSIPLIGEADPKNAAGEGKDEAASAQPVQSTSVPSAVESVASGSGREGAGKRRKG